jgi:hypothetical protein
MDCGINDTGRYRYGTFVDAIDDTVTGDDDDDDDRIADIDETDTAAVGYDGDTNDGDDGVDDAIKVATIGIPSTNDIIPIGPDASNDCAAPITITTLPLITIAIINITLTNAVIVFFMLYLENDQDNSSPSNKRKQIYSHLNQLRSSSIVSDSG